jgi:hypothetical protein
MNPTYQKPHRPASGPGDFICNPDKLGRLHKTLSGSRKTRRACGARLSPKSWLGAASRTAERVIHPVITEDDLLNL